MISRKNIANADQQLSWQSILKRVGWVLIAVGTVDIAYMVYCIAHQMSYRSSFNIFAVVAGIYLVKGNLRAANVIAWFAAFFVTSFLGSLILLPTLQPIGLWVTRFHISPIQTTIELVVAAFLIAILVWVYIQLNAPQLRRAQQETGVKIRRPITAVLAGVALLTLLGGVLHFVLKGDDAHKAMSMAARIDGPAYHYVVTSMSISSGHVVANVTAFKSNEIKSERVEFDE